MDLLQQLEALARSSETTEDPRIRAMQQLQQSPYRGGGARRLPDTASTPDPEFLEQEELLRLGRYGARRD